MTLSNGPLPPPHPPPFPHLHPEHAGVSSVSICIAMATGTEEGVMDIDFVLLYYYTITFGSLQAKLGFEVCIVQGVECVLYKCAACIE